MSVTDRVSEETLELVARHNGAMTIVGSMARELIAQRKLSQRDDLLKALQPFAKASDIKLCGEWNDDQSISQSDVPFYITFGDLRRARNLIDKFQKGGDLPSDPA